MVNESGDIIVRWPETSWKKKPPLKVCRLYSYLPPAEILHMNMRNAQSIASETGVLIKKLGGRPQVKRIATAWKGLSKRLASELEFWEKRACKGESPNINMPCALLFFFVFSFSR